MDQRISMLMTFGSTMKTSDYGLGQAGLEFGMVHRSVKTDMAADLVNRVRVRSVTGQTRSTQDASRAPSIRRWRGLARLFDRLEAWSWELEAWSWERETREREAYLDQAQDLYDLEARMRHLDGDEFSRRRGALP
jgi:hypothetical protein